MSLSSEADPFSPLFLGDVQSTADAIYQALTLSPQQRKSNWQKLFNYVSKYTAEAWGVSFVNERASMFSRFVFILSPLHRPVQRANSTCLLSFFLVNRLSGQRPSGPAGLAGRRKSGSLSRRSSKASIQRRKSSQSGGIVTGLGAAAGAAVNWAQSQVQGGSQA